MVSNIYAVDLSIYRSQFLTAHLCLLGLCQISEQLTRVTSQVILLLLTLQSAASLRRTSQARNVKEDAPLTLSTLTAVSVVRHSVGM